MPGEPIFVLRGQNNEIFNELRETRDISLVVNWVFFNIWSRRSFPYKTIEEGQTLYFVDTDARQIGAELRVTSVGREHYTDPADAFRTLDRVFGIGTEAAETALIRRQAPATGYMLAVAVDPVAYLGVPITIDWSKVGGRAGWAAWSTVLESPNTSSAARKVLRSLPPEGRKPAVKSFSIDTGALQNLADLPRAPRFPTSTAAKIISQRAKGRCEMKGCRGKAQHLDHIYPWAHGGNSDPINLQWLCAKHNLQKSDSIPVDYTPDQLWMRFVSVLADEQITLGKALRALEVRTQNSIYDVVIDDDIVLVWKRGAREVQIDEFTSEAKLIRRSGPGGRRLLLGPRGSWWFQTSEVVKVKRNVDPSTALARVGKKPGGRFDITHW